ncbi:MFS transporter [Robbsia sp. KACC 23696]|uniref:MFS transporter n=1 Tax=Robbsia sp. KACC 23696 TaxID=3149231 RepID=UPI00325BB13C
MKTVATGQLAVRRSRFRWVVIGLVFVIYTIAAADRANIGVALPFIRKEFAMSNTEAGALLSLFLLAYALAQLPSGFIIGRLGVRRIFSWSMILTSIFTGMIGTSASIFALKLFRFGLGLAEGPLPIGISATINNWFPPQEKGTAAGIFLSSVKFGPVIVPPLCAAIVSLWGWREIFYVFAVPGVLLSLVWYLLVKDRPSDSRYCNAEEVEYIGGAPSQNTAGAAIDSSASIKQAAAPHPLLSALDRLMRTRDVTVLTSNKAIFRSWNIYGAALGYCFQLGISSVLLAWIPTYLLTVKKFSVMNMGWVAAMPWVGAVIGNLLGGWMSDRVFMKRRKPGMMISALATAVMMYTLIHSPAEPAAFGILLFMTGVLLSLGFSAYMAYPMAMTTRETLPMAGAVVNMGGQLGGAMTPLATGMLLDSYGWGYVFLFMAIGSLISFVALLTIDEPRPD